MRNVYSIFVYLSFIQGIMKTGKKWIKLGNNDQLTIADDSTYYCQR